MSRNNNNFSVLPWYTRIDEQSHRRSYAYGEVYPLFTLANTFLPFQILRPHSEAEIASVEIYHKDGTLFADATQAAKETGLTVEKYAGFGYDVIIYPGTLPMTLAQPEGQFYAKMSDGVNTWYSEVYTAVYSLDGYLSIEWWDDEDAIFDAGRIAYKYGTQLVPAHVEEIFARNSVVETDPAGSYGATGTYYYSPNTGMQSYYGNLKNKVCYRLKQRNTGYITVFSRKQSGFGSEMPTPKILAPGASVDCEVVDESFFGSTKSVVFELYGDSNISVSVILTMQGGSLENKFRSNMKAGKQSVGVTIPKGEKIRFFNEGTSQAAVLVYGLFENGYVQTGLEAVYTMTTDKEWIYRVPDSGNYIIQCTNPDNSTLISDFFSVEEMQAPQLSVNMARATTKDVYDSDGTIITGNNDAWNLQLARGKAYFYEVSAVSPNGFQFFCKKSGQTRYAIMEDVDGRGPGYFIVPTDSNYYLVQCVQHPTQASRNLSDNFSIHSVESEIIPETEIAGTRQFKNRLYLCTELGRPDYPFEEQGESRDGYFFVQKQISEKTYRCTALAPEFLCDVMRFIRMADHVVVRDQFGRKYECDSFLISPKWQNQGYLASVEIEFQTDTVVKKIGTGVRRGDFNSDFNNDFNNY